MERPVPRAGGGRFNASAVAVAFGLHVAAATPLLLAGESRPPGEPVTIAFIMLEAPSPPVDSPPAFDAIEDMPLPVPPREAAAATELMPPSLSPPSPQAEPALPEVAEPEPEPLVEPEPLPEKLAEPEPLQPEPEIKPEPPRPVARPRPQRPQPATSQAPGEAPAQAAPAPTAPPQQRAGGVAADSYLASLLRHLNAFREYPAAARRRGQEGRVVVLVRLHPDGSVAGAALENGSGHELLDMAAMAMVRRASPFPPPPPQAPQHVRFPIDFALQR